MNSVREKLIEKIKTTGDEKLLEEIYQLFSDLADLEEAVTFPPEIIDRLEQSKNDIREGKYYSNDQVFREVDKWLEE